MKKLLIIDLESSCHPRGNEPRGFFSEIIEIGAILLDIDSRKVDWEFQRFVRPTMFPELSMFCRQLTTITQAEVDSGASLESALRELALCIADQDYRFASWGNYDCNQFKRNCERFGLPYPFHPEHLNLKAAFAAWMRGRPMGMVRALHALHLPLEGTHHRGLDDARNIGKIAIRMLDQGWRLERS